MFNFRGCSSPRPRGRAVTDRCACPHKTPWWGDSVRFRRGAGIKILYCRFFSTGSLNSSPLAIKVFEAEFQEAISYCFMDRERALVWDQVILNVNTSQKCCCSACTQPPPPPFDLDSPVRETDRERKRLLQSRDFNLQTMICTIDHLKLYLTQELFQRVQSSGIYPEKCSTDQKVIRKLWRKTPPNGRCHSTINKYQSLCLFRLTTFGFWEATNLDIKVSTKT